MIEFETSPYHASSDRIAMFRTNTPDLSPIMSKSVITSGGMRSIVFECDELPDGADQTYEFRYLIDNRSVAQTNLFRVTKDGKACVDRREETKPYVVAKVVPVVPIARQTVISTLSPISYPSIPASIVSYPTMSALNDKNSPSEQSRQRRTIEKKKKKDSLRGGVTRIDSRVRMDARKVSSSESQKNVLSKHLVDLTVATITTTTTSTSSKTKVGVDGGEKCDAKALKYHKMITRFIIFIE